MAVRGCSGQWPIAQMLLLVLSCAATTASGTSYTDYSSLKLPQYAAADYETEDYRDRWHKPARLDYNYEEESSDKIDKLETTHTEEDFWDNVTNKKENKRSQTDDDNFGHMDKYNIDEVVNAPKFKSSYWNKDIRGRHGIKGSVRNNASSKKRLENYTPNSEVEINKEQDVDTDYISQMHPEVLNKGYSDLEYQKNQFAFRHHKKNVRRKARDRPIHSPGSRIQDNIEDADIKRIRAPDPDYNEPEYFIGDVRSRRRDLVGYGSGQRRASSDNDEINPHRQSKVRINDYSDYYDMKRVRSIKKRLPNLLRRTQGVDTMSVVPASNAAKRELEALLVAHQKRKAESLVSNSPNLPTLSPGFVDPQHDAYWNHFILANHTPKLQISMYQLLLALINYLQRYLFLISIGGGLTKKNVINLNYYKVLNG